MMKVYVVIGENNIDIGSHCKVFGGKHAKENAIKDAENFAQFIVDNCVGTGDYQADQVKIDDHFKDDMRVIIDEKNGRSIVAGYISVLEKEVHNDTTRKN